MDDGRSTGRNAIAQSETRAANTSPETFIARRKSLGLTQAEVAAHFGVSKSTVSHWEQGVQRIPGYAMLALDALSRLHE